jgi:hypothetical protein
MQQIFFIVDLSACSTCFGHHYAHHQELESIIQLVTACGLWCLVFKSGLRAAAVVRKPDTQYRQLENQAPKTTGSNQLYNTLELLMMTIMVPETCWASNKICNKKHLLHPVGILFPHINDDARSKSLQIKLVLFVTISLPYCKVVHYVKVKMMTLVR